MDAMFLMNDPQLMRPEWQMEDLESELIGV